MQLLRRKKSGANVTAESAQKRAEDAFDAAGAGASFKVMTRDERGRLQFLSSIPASDVSAGNVEEVIKDLYGGGRFLLLPVGEDGRKRADGFEVNILGESKIRKKQRKDQDTGGKRSGGRGNRDEEIDQLRDKIKNLEKREEEDRIIRRVREEIKAGIPQSAASKEIISSLVAGLPQLMTGLAGIVGSKETASDMLEKISSIWSNIETSMPKTPDPVEQAQKMAQLIFQVVNQARPPVVNTAGTAGSGFWSTLIDQIARKFAGWTPAQGMATQALSGPGTTGQWPVQSGGLSGLEQVQPGQQPQPQQPAAVNLETISRSMALYNPINVIRDMIREREDVDRIAEVAVYLIDFLGNFAQPDAKWMPHIASFLVNPEAGFERAVSFIPELTQLRAQDNEYLRKLKSAVVKAARAYTSEVERQRQKAAQPASKPADQESPAQVDEQPEPHAVTADEDVQEGQEEKDEAAMPPVAD